MLALLRYLLPRHLSDTNIREIERCIGGYSRQCARNIEGMLPMVLTDVDRVLMDDP
jgi:hypothetical protein